ncbi:MAG: ATP-binding protein [Halobacteriales archaeon]|nr:ATP-binding protein [Halobacteriales archaeon]
MTTPYTDNRAHLRAELDRLDLLLRRHIAVWRAERGGGDHSGLYVSDDQVDRLLATEVADSTDRNGTVGMAASEEATGPTESDGTVTDTQLINAYTNELNRQTETIEARIQSSRKAETTLRLPTLADRFGLDRQGLDALLVAFAPEFDLKYEKVYAYLQDDLTRKRPTVGLILRVLAGTAGGAFEHRSLFHDRSSLIADRLVRLAGPENSLLSRFVEADARIVDYLVGGDDIDPDLADLATQIDPDESMDRLAMQADRTADQDQDQDGSEGTGNTGTAALTTNGGSQSVAAPFDQLPVDGKTRSALETLDDRIEQDRPSLVVFDGPYGAGHRRAIHALCVSHERPLITADASRLQPETAAETLQRFVREATLTDAALHLYNVPTVETPDDDTETVDRETIIDGITAYNGTVYLSGRSGVSARHLIDIESHDVVTYTFDRPGFDRRRDHWSKLPLPDGVDPDALAATFQLTLGQIEDAVSAARAIAIDGDPTPADIREACRRQSRERLGELAQRITPTYGLDDIVLPAEEYEHLTEVITQVEQRGRVFSDWGFEAAHSHGGGVNVLFAGPSGTGKTMAAEIVANETGLDLYRIDLATVVSKYIGETEGNLRRIFDEAAASNAVLFFDEADALFGERTEVQDSHDRYANVEVNYLLQRMEDHDGVVILATNLAENLDDAFQRRLNVSIEFPMPKADARERIWRSVFPAATPVGDLDWDFLASFDLAGGDINNAALTAAFLAADDSGTVEMRHAVRALYRELQKSGRLFSEEDFGEYQGLIEGHES